MRKTIKVSTIAATLLCLVGVSAMQTYADPGLILELTLKYGAFEVHAMVVGNIRGDSFSGSCSGNVITATIPKSYTSDKTIEGVTFTSSYDGFPETPLVLPESLSANIRTDGSIRKLKDGESVTITNLFIRGSTTIANGIQYGLSVQCCCGDTYGTLTKTGNIYEVNVECLVPEDGLLSLFVWQWDADQIVDSLYISMDGFLWTTIAAGEIRPYP